MSPAFQDTVIVHCCTIKSLFFAELLIRLPAIKEGAKLDTRHSFKQNNTSATSQSVWVRWRKGKMRKVKINEILTGGKKT